MFERVSELLALHSVLPGNGADDRDIHNAEDALGRLPDDYRYFLREYGWLSVQHLEIFGLGNAVPAYLDVVRMTRAERSEPGSPIPGSYVCVMNDGAGNLFCLIRPSQAQGQGFQ
ncbi:SMI1/KNR4 family protein [Krasilnikovia cinnamomea]|uniref:SMI1/KNR4 family protein n=1 Tax=Krasilnikovia cinnamomea TaxID=349313 RepID=UPI00102B3A36